MVHIYRTDLEIDRQKKVTAFFGGQDERATGCGGKNAKETEQNMWRRKDGEETDRPAYFN